MIHNQFVYESEHVIDSDILASEFEEFKKYYGLHNHKQISVTGPNENSGFDCSTGPATQLEYPELCYSKVLKEIQGTYTEQCINQFPDYYRWRFLILNPNTCYTIHRDINVIKMCPDTPININVRVHIPIISNPHSYMCFYDVKKEHFSDYKIPDGKTDVYYYNMTPGKVYNTCTSHMHSALNHGDIARIHLVGVKEMGLGSLEEIPEAIKF
jgi:hypothetical protein